MGAQPQSTASSDLERLTRDLAEAVEQQSATNQVLETIGRSDFRLAPVFETVAHHAARLCKADSCMIWQLDGDVYRLAYSLGESPEYRSLLERKVIARASGATAADEVGMVGLVGLERRTLLITDAQTDPRYEWPEALELGGQRSILGVPMLAGDQAIGVIVLNRHRVDPFDERTVQVATTFAAQGSIAIQNVQLFHELQARGDELEVVSDHKSEFLASMSHELRTPLNAVIGFSDVLLERMFGELNERQEEYLLDIRNSGQHLLELINEILDLSKVEAGRMELDVGPVTLVDLVAHGHAMVRQRATEHNIDLTWDVDPDVVLWADELKLRQVVLNLLSNAVKFTEDGGSVVLTARVTGDDVEVTIRDSGIGISEADQTAIFDAFQRGGRSARESTEGTGLGLTLSRRIVELHGGRIWVNSQVGTGSTFGFAIPMRSPPAQATGQLAEPTVSEERATDGAAPILIVEDDARSADLLTLHLEGAGLPVAVASDGVEGLDLAKRLRPRAIVLDVRLPRLDGWDLLALLKADPDTADVPVVVTSMIDEPGRGIALGAADYLLKPVSREQILGSLRRLLPAPTSNRTVVVIDDDPAELDLIDAVLGPRGYDVVRATTGNEGIDLVRSRHPSVVLLDLLMPGLDGFDVVERLRCDPATVDVPILVLTAKDITPGDRERLAGQISGLASKGVGAAGLVEVVERIVRRSAATGGVV